MKSNLQTMPALAILMLCCSCTANITRYLNVLYTSFISSVAIILYYCITFSIVLYIIHIFWLNYIMPLKICHMHTWF